MNVLAKIGRKFTKFSSSRKRRDKEPRKPVAAHDRRPNYHGGPTPSRRDLVSDFNRSTFVTPKNSPGQVSGTDYDGEAIPRSNRSLGLSVETLDEPFVEFGGHGTEAESRNSDGSGLKRNAGPKRKFQKEKGYPNGVLPKPERVPSASLESKYLHAARFHEEVDSERVALNCTKKRLNREIAIPVDRTLRWLSDNGAYREWDNQCEDIDRDFETNSFIDQTGTVGFPDANDEPRYLKMKLRDVKEERISEILQTDSRNTRSAITPGLKSDLFKLRCVLFQNDENPDSALSLQNMPEKEQKGEIGLDFGLDEGPDKPKAKRHLIRRSSSLSELTRYHRYMNFLSFKQGGVDLPKNEAPEVLHSTIKSPVNSLNLNHLDFSSQDRTSARESILPEVKNRLIAAILSPRPFLRPNKHPTALRSEQTDAYNTRQHPFHVVATVDENKITSHTTHEAEFSSPFTNTSITNSEQNQPVTKDFPEVEKHSMSIESGDVVHAIVHKLDPVKFRSSGQDEPVENTMPTFEAVRRRRENGQRLPFHFHQSGTYQAQQHSHKDRLLLQLIGEEEMADKYLLPAPETRDPRESNSNGLKTSPSELTTDNQEKVDSVLKIIPLNLLSNNQCTTQEIRRQSRKGWGGRRHPDLI